MSGWKSIKDSKFFDAKAATRKPVTGNAEALNLIESLEAQLAQSKKREEILRDFIQYLIKELIVDNPYDLFLKANETLKKADEVKDTA